MGVNFKLYLKYIINLVYYELNAVIMCNNFRNKDFNNNI